MQCVAGGLASLRVSIGRSPSARSRVRAGLEARAPQSLAVERKRALDMREKRFKLQELPGSQLGRRQPLAQLELLQRRQQQRRMPPSARARRRPSTVE
jgi:hypothetical protein